MMRHLSINELKGKQRKRLADARRLIYRQVLRDPGATPTQKSNARRKIASAAYGETSR